MWTWTIWNWSSVRSTIGTSDSFRTFVTSVVTVFTFQGLSILIVSVITITIWFVNSVFTTFETFVGGFFTSFTSLGAFDNSGGTNWDVNNLNGFNSRFRLDTSWWHDQTIFTDDTFIFVSGTSFTFGGITFFTLWSSFNVVVTWFTITSWGFNSERIVSTCGTSRSRFFTGLTFIVTEGTVFFHLFEVSFWAFTFIHNSVSSTFSTFLVIRTGKTDEVTVSTFSVLFILSVFTWALVSRSNSFVVTSFTNVFTFRASFTFVVTWDTSLVFFNHTVFTGTRWGFDSVFRTGFTFVFIVFTGQTSE